MTTYHKRHIQEVAAEKWVIDLPAGVSFPRVEQVYNLGSNPVSWAYQQAIDDDGHLVIDFGLDVVSGIAEYVYETDADTVVDPIVGEGGVINIHIHQYK